MPIWVGFRGRELWNFDTADRAVQHDLCEWAVIDRNAVGEIAGSNGSSNQIEQRDTATAEVVAGVQRGEATGMRGDNGAEPIDLASPAHALKSTCTSCPETRTGKQRALVLGHGSSIRVPSCKLNCQW